MTTALEDAKVDPTTIDERPFRQALENRDRALAELGRAALRVLLLGGELVAAFPEATEPELATEPERPVNVTRVVASSTAPPAPKAVTPAPEPARRTDVIRRGVTAPPRPQRRRRVLGAAVVRPPSEPATAEQLRKLVGAGLTPNWTQKRVESDPAAMRTAVEAFGPPPTITDIIQYDRAMRRLVAGVQVDQWKPFPRDLQKALVGYASSLARHLQDEAGPSIGLTHPPSELSTMFSVMTRYSDMERPGFVSGLSRKNPPDHGTWAGDMAWWWGRLQRLLPGDDEEDGPDALDAAWAAFDKAIADGPEQEALLEALGALQAAGVSSEERRLLDALFPHAHLLEGVVAFKTLRKRLSGMAESEEDEVEAVDQQSPLPDDWPFKERTEGKVGVILGGDPRPRARQRLQDAFGFAELTWEIADGRRTQALADRVKRNTVDVVIVLRRFVSHKLTDVLLPACRAAEVPFVIVDTGYGVAQTRLAMERYLN